MLSDAEIAAALAGLPGWAREGDMIVKTYERPSFPEAIEFVGRIAQRAEAADHHPDILIQYKHVTLTLSTHSAGGLTAMDFELAREANGLKV